MVNQLKLPRDTKQLRIGGKTLFFNPKAPAWLVTNKNGELILALCNGKRTPAEITEIFGARYGQEHKPIVGTFLKGAISSNIFSDDIFSEVIRTSDYKLRILQLSLTSNCNLKCSYCYATDRKEQGERALCLEDYRKVIEEAAKMSSGIDVVLTGGEPLLNPDCFSIAEYANRFGCHVQLLTNGTLINESNVQDIKNLFRLVKISIDGSTKELHEKHRGVHSYEAANSAITLLSAANVNYAVSMTVTKLNIHDIGAMTELYGSRLAFAPLFKAGNAKKSKACISGDEYFTALSKVQGVNPLSYCDSSLESAKRHKICKCAIGDAEISISATGDVYPCQLLHNREFYAGNILKSSFIDIYNTSDVLQTCRHLTVDNLKGCSKCYLRYVCGGACRARAFYECGNIRVSGKFCEYEKKAFVKGIMAIYSENALQTTPQTEDIRK